MVLDQVHIWDSEYSGNSTYFGDAPSLFGVRSADDFKLNGKMNIVELGAGQGRDTRHFIDKGLNVIAMDFSDVACDQLRQNLGHKVMVVKRDLRKGLDMPANSVDGIYGHMFLTMDFTDDELKDLIKDIYRTLMPGGLFIFSVRNTNDSDYLSGEKVRDFVFKNQKGFNVRYYDKSQIDKLFGDFEIVRMNEFNEGMKVLYGITARKPMA